VPSVRRQVAPRVGLGLTVASVGLLAGCTSTQTTAARERLNSAREVAAQTSTIVRHGGSAVLVSALAVVTGTRVPRTAVVVTLSNRTAQPLSDLPISVGYTLDGKRSYLNSSESLGYFGSHIPLLDAHGQSTWVFSSARKLPIGAHPFALVGAQPSVGPGPIPGTPTVSATAVGSASGGSLEVRVDNTSGIPQDQLQVYVDGTRGNRVVTAGVRTVSYIGSGSMETVRIPLAGAPGGATVHLKALPTIYK
jgi:hypothetical protein